MKDISKYNLEYQRENIVRKVIKFNRRNKEDLAMLDWIAMQSSWSNYCKRLIQTDMQEHKTKK